MELGIDESVKANGLKANDTTGAGFTRQDQVEPALGRNVHLAIKDVGRRLHPSTSG